MALKALGTGTGYLKAGLLGFAKSGKTYTAVQLAIGLREMLKLDGPIAMFDTETGSEYIAPMVLKATGKPLLGVKSRAFSDMMQFGKDCIQEKVSIAIIDSISHTWRELCDSYLAQLNQKRIEQRKSKLMKLEFQHWSAIKGAGLWQDWTEFFLNSPLHIIICGRAGYEWEMERNEDTGRNELIKAGTKMRVESEFGFESSLLVEMERVQVPVDGRFKITHKATILGDRFNVIDGHECENPTFEFFKPHCQLLMPGSWNVVDTQSKTQTGADEEGDADWQREKRARTILTEEIQGLIVEKYPGQSAEEKKTKAALINQVFGTRSWTAVENMRSEQLREGLSRLKQVLGVPEPPPVSSSGTVASEYGIGGPPKTPQDDSAGVNTPPAPQTPQEPPSPAGGSPILTIRAWLQNSKPKLTERALLEAMTSLGSVEAGTETLEQVALLKPELLPLIIEQLPNLHKAILATKK